MKIGIFSKVYQDFPLTDAFLEIKNAGMDVVQFNMSNVGLSSLPDIVPDEVIQEIECIKNSRKIEIEILSGTFNLLELDENKRTKNFANFKTLLEVASKLKIPFVSISTGSFNQENFWAPHPDNSSDRAWTLLFSTLDVMLEDAKELGITIVVEPEQANVVQSVEDTLRLMNHYDSANLKVLYDPANIINIFDRGQELEKIKSSIDALKDHIVAAHLKDLKYKDDKIVFVPVGQGILPLREYLDHLSTVFEGPVIMHGLHKEDVQKALTYIGG